MVEVTCNGCGEVASETASTYGNHYRGVYHSCLTRDCVFFDRIVAVTPPTLCDHTETKKTPSTPGNLAYLYCADCGRLKRDWGKGYESTTAPWAQ